MAIPKDEWRLLAFAAVVFMLSAFILANEPEGGSSALWYIYLTLFWVGTSIWAKGNQGIPKTWMKDIGIGAVFGGVFILLNTWSPAIFRLGYPQTIESVRFIIVGLIAPMAEELAFRQGIYFNLLRNKNKFSAVKASIITSVVFTAFHWYAYGASLGSSSAAFIGAFTFSLLACWLQERTKSLVPGVIMHMAVNIYLVSSAFVVFGT